MNWPSTLVPICSSQQYLKHVDPPIELPYVISLNLKPLDEGGALYRPPMREKRQNGITIQNCIRMTVKGLNPCLETQGLLINVEEKVRCYHHA